MIRRRLRLPDNRLAVTLCATACFAAAFALIPSTVRSQLAPPHDVVETPAPPAPAPPSPLAVVADPFVPRLAGDDTRDRAAPLAAHLPAKARPAIRLSAIATGPHPSAIVEVGSSVEAVSAGDLVDGALVKSISATGLELGDGRRVSLAPARPAP